MGLGCFKLRWRFAHVSRSAFLIGSSSSSVLRLRAAFIVQFSKVRSMVSPYLRVLCAHQPSVLCDSAYLYSRRLMVSLSRLAMASLAVLAVHAAPVSAQMKAFECYPEQRLSEEEGKSLMSRVQARYMEISTLHGEFSQESYVAALDQGEQSAGRMWFSKPGKMRWEYNEPRKQLVVIRENTLWLYQPDKGQVLIDDISQVLLSQLPVAFMSGLGNLSNDFTFRGACKSPEGIVLSLVPKSPEKKGESKESGAGTDELEGFELLVSAGQNLPQGARVTSLGGNVTAILFRHTKTSGVEMKPSTFVLEYPNGVDIIDRRQKK
jgi:outer membrane lipoprotein carrier protein